MVLVRLLELIACLLLLIAMYWAPTMIAFGRRARHGVAIAVLNSLTGWTVAGWLAALVWSLAAEREPQPDSASIIVAAARTESIVQTANQAGALIAH